jgi:predicted nucleic acid-binding protein
VKTVVDTSAWVEFFNHGDSRLAGEVARLVEHDEAVVTGLVRCEILAGFRDGVSFLEAREILAAFEEIEDGTREVRDLAVDLYRRGRRKGITIRGLVDCLIAAAAIRSGLPVLQRDRDFAALARVSPLRLTE